MFYEPLESHITKGDSIYYTSFVGFRGKINFSISSLFMVPLYFVPRIMIFFFIHPSIRPSVNCVGVWNGEWIRMVYAC